nr:hypothetical protein [Candidatus Sigynarchaeota archaeon]
MVSISLSFYKNDSDRDLRVVTLGYRDPSFSRDWAAALAGIMEKFLAFLAASEGEDQPVERFMASVVEEKPVGLS